MAQSVQIDDVFGVLIYSHRHEWNGTICANALSWNCGSPRQFRQDFCALGDPRCHALRIFDPKDPQMLVIGEHVQWLLGDEPWRMENQVLFLISKRAEEPYGIPEAHGTNAILVGFYRIRAIEAYRPAAHVTHYRIRPHPDGWATFPWARVPSPRFMETPGATVKRSFCTAVEAKTGELLRALENQAGRPGVAAGDLERARKVCSALPEWLKEGQTAWKARPPKGPLIDFSSIPRGGDRGLSSLGDLLPPTFVAPVAPPQPPPAPPVPTPSAGKKGKPSERPTAPSSPASTPVVPTPPAPLATTAPQSIVAPAALSTKPDPAPLEFLEEASRSLIGKLYGSEVLAPLELGLAARKIIILRGPPGVGKSHLAGTLVSGDDGRLLIVPVGSTWRGAEDLLGYINPVSGEFEPTTFTNFLHEAQKAWEAGDRRLRIVVFEEFNLSQPEHWCSEILTRDQYPEERRKERTIPLGGRAVRGWGGGSPEVFLSPALRFVATLNADHTTKELSPRVLDRASILELDIEPRDVLTALGIELEEEIIASISDLHDHLRRKGGAFSFRTAKSVREGLALAPRLGLNRWQTIDHLLVTGVLRKMRWYASDPLDESTVKDLVENWSALRGENLPLCRQTVNEWRETLSSGRDVEAG